MPASGLLISSDLFFASKVTGTASALGLKVDLAGGLEQAKQRLSEQNYGCVILDLGTPGLAVADVVALLPSTPRPRVIAFGSHVQTARLQEARDAGCDQVMPRSRFTAELPLLLQSALSGLS